MAISNPSWQPSCPSGGTWYACGNGTQFTGCCRSYPCIDTGCPVGNLEPASFLPSQFSNIPDQECSAGSWFKCNATTPPFLGCCKSNPCAANGCPDTDLAVGFLSGQASIANQFDPQPPLAGQNSTNSTNTSTPSSSSTNVGAIAGGVAGGVAFIAIVAIVIWLLVRWSRRRGDTKNNRGLLENKGDWFLSSQGTPPNWERGRSLDPTDSRFSPSPSGYHYSPSAGRNTIHEADSTTYGQTNPLIRSPESSSEQSAAAGFAPSSWSPDLRSDRRQSNITSSEARYSDVSNMNMREYNAQGLAISNVRNERYELNG